MTQKPDSSHRSSSHRSSSYGSSKSVKIWVNPSKQKRDRPDRSNSSKSMKIGGGQNDRATRARFLVIPAPWRQRIWLIWVVSWILGILTALMPIAVAQVSRSSVLHVWGESMVQTIQSFAPLSTGSQTDALPRATVGLTQPSLWSHAATLAAHFGHLPYPKADLPSLIPFPNQASPYPYASRSGETLHPDAAAALEAMINAARSDSVWIVLVSGFRDLTTQQRLFEDRTGVVGSVEEAAKFVAPPGYSEHHTGYAIDVTDGSGLGFYAFEQTPAFQWMQVHAHEFGFELSFPLNNPQGIDFEPWHWRFVGSPEAARIFAAARGE
ncbi:M15 family metallopeptidase [Egbenema bharatensis]|uniref:M15 family metallopeptidase n=1 Tax=Egbenema bharatensis TaxID=3463334 RepID=UPI003A88D84D